MDILSPNLNDIVKFVVANSEAAAFCMGRGITGKIVKQSAGELFEIDVGFDYNIYAHPGDLEVVATQLEVPFPEDIT